MDNIPLPKQTEIVTRAVVHKDPQKDLHYIIVDPIQLQEMEDRIIKRSGNAGELLSALEGLLETAQGGCDDSPCHSGICSRQECAQCQRVDFARAAITKANAK